MINFFKNNLHAFLILLISGVGIFIIGFAIFLWLISLGAFGPMPSQSDLKSIQTDQASRILSADSVQIGTFHHQNRTVVSLDDVNPAMTDALLAIEDIRFHNHNGIDHRALGRVIFRTILLQQNAGGGSTITQQLVKNLYPRENGAGISIVIDKFREMMIARRIESIYSKEEILELYLNTVSFGENTYGIEMASKRFFNKSPKELNTPEAATLAGLLKATTLYNPNRNPDRSLQRRNLVLSQMKRYDFISDSSHTAYTNKPLALNYTRGETSRHTGRYFKEQLRQELQLLFSTRPALDGQQYNFYTDGLTIHTTLHSEIQKAAEDAVQTHLKELQKILDRERKQQPLFSQNDPDILSIWRQSAEYRELKNEGVDDDEIEELFHTPSVRRVFTWDGYKEKNISPYEEIEHYLSFLNAGFVAMNPANGHVAAWVGGINYGHFQYDQVRASRQPGSAFKPVLYATALENGKKPCDYLRNVYTTYTDYDDWTPRNVDEEYGGRYSMQAALAKSVNTIAVDLVREIGVPTVQHTSNKMGINRTLPDGPSIALGTAEVSLLELTTAYTSFFNGGKPSNPVFITHITNAEGDLIYDFTLPGTFGYDYEGSFEPDEVISPETAAAMVQMLQKAVDDGTGSALRNQFHIQAALGGKTGTTQNFSDGWYIGFTPDLVFGTRVGGFNQRVRFRNFPGYASQTTLPVAGHFLQQLSATQNEFLTPRFYDFQLESEHNFSCADYKDDRLRDRLRDFFSGRDSDEPRKISDDDSDDDNVLKRLGRRLFGSSSDSDNDNDDN